MMLQVAVQYRIRLVPPGRRDEVERVCSAPVFVEVSESDAVSAPVALRYREGGAVRSPRHHGGRLWLPHGPAGGGLDAAGLAAIAAAPPEEGDPFGRTRVNGTPAGPGEEGRARAGNPDAASAIVHQAAAALLVVDGVLHRPAPEPFYRVEDGGLRAAVIVQAGGKPGDPLATYAADEADVMEEERGVAPAPGARIEVLLPGALEGGAPSRALVRAAEMARGRLAAAIADGGWETFGAYKGLRDALAAAGPRPSPQALAEALAGPLRACLGHGVGMGDHFDGIVSRALARHERASLGAVAAFAP